MGYAFFIIFIYFLLWLFSSSAFAEETSGGGGFTFPFDWILGKINDFIAVLNRFIQAVWSLITDFFKSVMLTLFDVLKDIVFWIFEQFFDLIIYALSGLDSLVQLIDITSLVSGLPDEVTNMMGLLGLGHCIGVIGIAIIIRILLQLIPFTRLGS